MHDLQSPFHMPAGFRVEVDAHREAVRVAPVGELDLATAPALQAQLDELWEAGCADIVLDLRQLEFLDSTGIRLIVTEHRRARRLGAGFGVISGPPAIERTLRLCGVIDYLHWCDP